jgi:hypothetical protein
MLLCWNDFKQKIVKPKSYFRYYTLLFLFLSLNFTVYLGLFLLILKTSPLALFVNPENYSEFFQDSSKLFQPMLIAILYFGAGVATFKFGNVEINLNRRMLEIFQSIFKISQATYEEIKQTIYKTTAERAKLESMINEFQTDAGYKGWDKLENKWKDIQEDTAVLDGHINELNSVDSQLQEPISFDQINTIKQNIHKAVDNIQAKVINNYKKYIFEFIITNLRDEREIEKLLNAFFSFRPEAQPKQKVNVVYRSLVVSFLFGLMLGLVLYISNKGANNLEEYSWRGITALSVFGILLSLIRKTKKGFQDLLNVIVIGGLAGLCGTATWMLFQSGAKALQWVSIKRYSLYGISFGVVIALALFIFKEYVANRVVNILIKYIGIGFCGALGFCLTAFLFFNEHMQGIGPYIGIGAVGFIVLIAMAFALDIFGNDVT